MPDPAGKAEVQALVEASLERVAASDKPLSEFRGVALYDTRKDENFTSLDAFEPAVESLASDPAFSERFGNAEARRVALQFVYNVIELLSEASFDRAAFESTWLGFSKELARPEWIQLGIANLRHFATKEMLTDLGEGISVRGRSEEDLRSLGLSNFEWQKLLDEVMQQGFGVSSFVLVAEHRFPKSPDNFILTDGSTPWVNAQRMIGALRLLAAGDVSMGRMLFVRSAAFNVGIGGVTMTGFSLPAPPFGTDYTLTPAIISSVPKVYKALRTLETAGYRSAPGNLDLAVRAFMATYDRSPGVADSQILDAITALESVLGSGTEIAFKLAYRVAGILATDERERVELFADMKRFYDTRSAIVHGTARRPKHLRELDRDRVNRLRALVRELLRALVLLATSTGHAYDRKFFSEQLDTALLQETERERLRAAMGLD